MKLGLNLEGSFGILVVNFVFFSEGLLFFGC